MAIYRSINAAGDEIPNYPAESWQIAAAVGDFDPDDHNAIAQLLIKHGRHRALIEHLERFVGLDHNEVALAIIEAGHSGAVAIRLCKFTGLNNELALALIGRGYGDEVANNLQNFEGMDYSAIAAALISGGYGGSLVNNLAKCCSLDHTTLALALIDAGRSWAVAAKLGKFFERILESEPDALAAARAFTGVKRGEITSEEFSEMLQVARTVGAHRPAVRELHRTERTL